MHTPHALPIRPLRRQRGLSLLFALIALVVLMLGALALVRNVDTGTQLLGNLGFKQDATASADQFTRQAVNWLSANSASLNVDIGASGYYASSREFDTDGVTVKGPIDVTGNQFPSDTTRQLIDWDNNNCSNTATGTYASCDIKPVAIATPVNGNTASYVILRMCNKTGDYSADSSIKCAKPLTSGSDGASGRGDMSYTDAARYTTSAQTYFRVLVRVSGFRNTTSVTETIVHF